MPNQFSRTQLLLGSDSMAILHNSRVAVFGIGGVGGYTVEALARSGIGALDIIDNDRICLTNLNRQIIATHDTIDRLKVDVAEERIKSINPDCAVTKHPVFFSSDNADEFDFSRYDYIVDAIDTVSAKLLLAERAKAAGTPIISSMGAGNKLDPTAFRVTDIYKTSMCPLARVMRRELRKRNIHDLKVVYSTEQAICPVCDTDEQSAKRQIAGSTAFVPPVAGLIIAGEVIKDLVK